MHRDAWRYAESHGPECMPADGRMVKLKKSDFGMPRKVVSP